MVEKYRITIEDDAEDDFDLIIRFLLTNYSKLSAERAVVAIKDKIASLSRFPEAHPIYHKSRGPQKIEYRYVIAKKVHRIIFTVQLEEQHVIISRMAHVQTPKERIIPSLEEE